MIYEFYNIGYVYENGIKVPILPPSETLPRFEQFKYYYYKEIRESLKKRYGERNFNLTKRSATGNASARAFGPGSEYEIDATIGNYHLVHSLNRLNIGKPIVYYVKDVFSRLVAGFSVGMNHMSWRTGIIALENASTNKADYCAQFGINMTIEEWPSLYLPRRLLADRGEFESDYVEDCIENLGLFLILRLIEEILNHLLSKDFRIMDNRSNGTRPSREGSSRTR